MTSQILKSSKSGSAVQIANLELKDATMSTYTNKFEVIYIGLNCLKGLSVYI